MKTCTRCQKVKMECDFQQRKASKDGLTASCRDCLAEYDRSRANLPHRVEARIAYHKTERGKLSGNAAKHRFILKHPFKRKAHIIVGNFLRDGKLIRPERCEKCRADCKPQAHHCDYTKPIEVMWLCKKCHTEWHKYNTPIYPDNANPQDKYEPLNA